MEEVHPEILIISNKHDYSTDYVASHLHKMGASYLRLNRDQFREFKISLIPSEQRLLGETRDLGFEIDARSLRSIYFRAPIYLRDNYQPELQPDQQLSRSQWAAFIRGLSVFDDTQWVNYPQATYMAEIKPYQLYMAGKIGFDIPRSTIANTVHHLELAGCGEEQLVVKTLDPLILRIRGREAFIYTNIVRCNELEKSNISTAPVILQEALIPKIDLRVTIVGDTIFTVDIKQDGEGIEGDWRRKKDNLQYNRYNLPSEVEKKCVALMNALHLRFGAIDLAIHEGKYYFLEINPTGEWVWLVEHTEPGIDVEIAKLLVRGKPGHSQRR